MVMKKFPGIWDIERKYLAGEVLSRDEVQIAELALESPVFDERVVACEALLRSDCPETIETKAIDVLRELCQQVSQRQQELHSTLILVLLLLPKEIMLEDTFKRFVYDCARAADPGCRTNAVLIVEQLVKLNDEAATRVLKRALDDDNEMVRHNARSSIRRLGLQDGGD